MKKIVFALLLVLSLLLVSCGGGGDAVTDPPKTDPPKTDAPSTDMPITDAPDTAEPVTTAAPETEPPVTEPPIVEDFPKTQNNLLFTTDKEGIYNYCPSVIQEEDGTRYIYYCANQVSYNITDYIGCRKGTPDENGVYSWSEETVVLSPTEGTWDARHTCDPSVIKGSFSYDGKQYSYLMAYLGCVTNNSQDNEIGFAVAETPVGPFKKIGTEPFVAFVRDQTTDAFQWGVGQPSLVSCDKGGKVYLFYTKGDPAATRVLYMKLDLSDLASPKILEDEEVSESGLWDLNGNWDFMNNADFAISRDGKKLYSASDAHPNPPDTPNYIAGSFRVVYASYDPDKKLTNIYWRFLANIGETQTSFARNHNVCLVRDEYGYLPNYTYLTVYYTRSDTGDSSLWSYRLYDYNIKLK